MNYRALYISDANNDFGGTIICGIGHLTSFFPEKLMTRGKNFRVEGLRCYWRDGVMAYQNGEMDCDEVYEQLHHGLDETKGNGFAVYPNPANNVLFVETVCTPSLPDQTIRITNVTGQTLLQGIITAENQWIDIEELPSGLYFISVGKQTLKFVKQ